MARIDQKSVYEILKHFIIKTLLGFGTPSPKGEEAGGIGICMVGSLKENTKKLDWE